jgi:uncharacterized protein
MKMGKRIAFYVWALLPWVSGAEASFDCSKARSQREKLVCGSEELQLLDSQLNTVYKNALKRIAKPSGQKKLKSEQKAWLQLVAEKCKDGACIKTVTNQRITALNAFDGSKNLETVFENPNQDDGESSCNPDISVQNKSTLQGDIQSETKRVDTMCEGAAHPGCHYEITNTIKGQALPLKMLFKTGTDPVGVLQKICETEQADPKVKNEIADNGWSWTQRCDEISLNRLALRSEGIAIYYDRSGPNPCDLGEIIEWKKLKDFLDPKGPVKEAHAAK